MSSLDVWSQSRMSLVRQRQSRMSLVVLYVEFVKDLPKDERKELKELPRKKKQGRPLLLGNELSTRVC